MRAILFFYCSLFFAQIVVSQSPTRTGKDYAVFFVASKFDNGWKTLPDAPGEVQILATDLRDDYGFNVVVVNDAKRADIVRTLSEYKRKIYGPDDQLLLFFSMHGFHDAGSDKGYLIPKDGLYDDPIYESWLAHSQLADISASIPCRRILVSLDACYSGIFSNNRDRPVAAAWETGNDCQARAKAAFTGKDQTRKYVAAGGDQRVPAKSDFAVQWHRALQQGYGDDGLLSFAELAALLDQFKEPRPVWGDFVRSTFGDFVFVRKNGCAVLPLVGEIGVKSNSRETTFESKDTIYFFESGLRKLQFRDTVGGIADFKTAYKLGCKNLNQCKLLGEIAFRIRDNCSSAFFYEQYIGLVKAAEPTDLYKLGLAQYYCQDDPIRYEKAEKTFIRITQLVPTAGIGWLWSAKAATKLEVDVQLHPDLVGLFGRAKPYWEKYAGIAAADKQKNKKDLVSAYEYLTYYFFLKGDDTNMKTNGYNLLELDPANRTGIELMNFPKNGTTSPLKNSEKKN